MARSGNSAIAVAFTGAVLGAVCVICIVLHISSSSSSIVGLQRTQKLWNAAHNDVIGGALPVDEHYDGRDANRVNKHISQWMQMADSQGETPEAFKSAITQKLYIVPQANVLTGMGQKVEKSNGKEDKNTEKEADVTAAVRTMKKSASAAKKQQNMQSLSELQRTQKLWNAAHNDVISPADEEYNSRDIQKVNQHITQWMQMADSQGKSPVAFKGATTQKLALTAARTTQLWDAATNDQSLESTRQSMGMRSSQAGSRSNDRMVSQGFAFTDTRPAMLFVPRSCSPCCTVQQAVFRAPLRMLVASMFGASDRKLDVSHMECGGSISRARTCREFRATTSRAWITTPRTTSAGTAGERK